MSPALLIALAVGAYLLFQSQQQPASTSAPPSAPPQTGGSPPGGARAPVNVTSTQPVAATPPTPASSQTSLANAYAQLTQLEASMVGVDPAVTNQGGQITASFDVHNYYLGQVLGSVTLPNDCQVNQAWCGQVPILTLSQYWGAVSPWLAANRGMSGIKVPKFMSGGWR